MMAMISTKNLYFRSGRSGTCQSRSCGLGVTSPRVARAAGAVRALAALPTAPIKTVRIVRAEIFWRVFIQYYTENEASIFRPFRRPSLPTNCYLAGGEWWLLWT
jgi:hypothetical protein